MFEKEEVLEFEKVVDKLTKTDKEMLKKLSNLVTFVNTNLEKYRFKDVGDAIYHFIWKDLADFYIEHIKEREDKAVVLSVFMHIFSESLKLLHPYMPFVTEEIWAHLAGKEKSLLIISEWPKA